MNKNTLQLFTVIFALYASAADLVQCSDPQGTALSFSSSSFDGMPRLSFQSAEFNLSLAGKNQVAILQYQQDSFYVDAADRDLGISYTNVQLEVPNQPEFDASVRVSRVMGCTRLTTEFPMHCTKQEVVF